MSIRLIAASVEYGLQMEAETWLAYTIELKTEQLVV
jgi:hypothetical protein